MRSNARERGEPAGWEVARPRLSSRVAGGVDMAGFRVPRTPEDGLRLVPHPAVTLVVEFGEGVAVVDDGVRRHRRGSAVAGPGFGSGGTVRAWAENVACVQVRFSPLVVRAVLGVSPAELSPDLVALDDLWGHEASRIRERLAESADWDERFAFMDAVLARRRSERARGVDPEVAWAWQRITAGAGLVRVEGLADELGWSRKRLWSRFNAQIGMPPKRAASLVRFDHAAHRLVAGERAARVAADGGYFDQSHLHRDVMMFAGATPSTVVDEPFLTVDDVAWPTTARHSPGRTSPVSYA